jgi:hypothetical protein
MTIRVEYIPMYPRKFDKVYVVENICPSKRKIVVMKEHCAHVIPHSLVQVLPMLMMNLLSTVTCNSELHIHFMS